MNIFTVNPVTRTEGKKEKTFFEVFKNGEPTGRGSYDDHSARFICRNENNKAAREAQDAATADFQNLKQARSEYFEAKDKEPTSAENIYNFLQK